VFLLAATQSGYAGEPAEDMMPERLSVAATTMFLEVSINGQPTHTIVSFLERSNSIWAQPQDLVSLGIQLGSAGNAWVDLAGIAGLQYRLDRGRQTIDLWIEDSLRAASRVGGTGRPPIRAVSDTGVVINYDARTQTSGSLGPTQSSFSLGSEQRLFSPWGIFSNTGLWSCCGAESRYLREFSYFQYDDRDRLTTYQAGDGLTSSLSFTRPVRFAGMQVRSNFALDPQLVAFPMPALAGTAALPSTIDLYVNNVHQFSGEVPAGPFVLERPVGLTGAGTATLVVRDELGHAVTTSLPIYVDNRLLAPGIVSYSFEAGVLRYDYGQESSDYSGNAAFSGTYRKGVNEFLTLEAHSEASGRLVSSAVGALFQLPRAGVIHVAASGSTQGSDQGGQYFLGYQLILPLVSLTAQSQRATPGYGDLGSLRSVAPPRRLDQLTVSAAIRPDQTLGASYMQLDDSIVGRSKIWSLSYSAQLGKTTSAFVSASDDRAQRGSRSLWVGISAALGNRTSGWTDFGTVGRHKQYGASVMRAADYAGGWDWGLQGRKLDSGFNGIASAGYLGEHGELSALVDTTTNHTGLSVEGSGGIVIMDGAIEAARRVGAGFALVSTDGLGGVSILHENRLIGSTDAGGHLLVPDLNPYESNKLAFDPLTLPAEASFTTDRQEIAPRGNSGVLAEFRINRLRAVTLVLRDASGQVVPAGTAVTHIEAHQQLVVGYDGELYIEHPAVHNRLEIATRGEVCVAQFDFPASMHDGLTNLGSIICRISGEKST